MSEFENEIFSLEDQAVIVVAAWHAISDITENDERHDYYKRVHDRMDAAPGGVFVLLTEKDLSDLLDDIAESNPVRKKLEAAQRMHSEELAKLIPSRTKAHD